MQEEFRYLPVSRRDRQWGLYVTGAGMVNEAPRDWDPTQHPSPYYYRWEKGRKLADEYAALYLPHSRLELESEVSAKGIMRAGSFIVLCPGVWHRYRPPVDEANWKQYWITFGGSYADHLVREGFLSRAEPVHHVGPDMRLVAPYRRLLDRLKAAPLGLQQLLAAGLTEILGVAVNLARADCGSDLGQAVVGQARSILEQRVEEAVDMQELADSLGIGYHHFRRVFKQLTGIAPYHYHLQLRIGRAKQLLLESELSIKEIAKLLKFDDPYHFSKSFKQHIGLAPSEWRKSASAPAAR